MLSDFAASAFLVQQSQAVIMPLNIVQSLSVHMVIPSRLTGDWSNKA
jgi:hypothetical protein